MVPGWGDSGPSVERVDVSEPASISTGIAARYATAIFELAKEEKALPALEADLGALSDVLGSSEDFQTLISSPVYPRAEQSSAMVALAEKMGLSVITKNLLALMGENRRLFVLPYLITETLALIAAEKGEVTAEVTSAQALSAEQEKKLAETLKSQVGKDVKVKLAVDESLIGGLVVKVGSKMIDTSIAAKLAKLQNAMKEAG